MPSTGTPGYLSPFMERWIQLNGVRHNNLKNIQASFPHKKLTVITGLSGSGKSSLAFETLYAEGQRRYVESLSTYTRQFLEKMPKPDLDSVENIPPAIALEQRNHIVNSRSTVGTQTEIVDYLRILYAKIGHTSCVKCGGKVQKIMPESLVDQASRWFVNRKGVIAAPVSAPDPAKTPNKQKKTKKPARTLSLFTLLREQGFRRVLIPNQSKKKGTPILLDLEEPENESLLAHAPRVWVVIDRLKISGPDDPDLQARLFDSIHQAAAVGKGKVVFVDLDTGVNKEWDCRFACVDCGTEHREPEPQLFSFNSPIGACPRCSGFGYNLELDENLVVPVPTKTLKNGAIDPFSKPSFEHWQKIFFRFMEKRGISIGRKYSELTPTQRKMIWDGDPENSDYPGIHAIFKELEKKKYKIHVRVFIRRYQNQVLCPECKGARLKSEALAVRVGKLHLPELLDLTIGDALEWIKKLKLTQNEMKISQDIFQQIVRRMEFLVHVGVEYLTLSRLAKTLSGGEFQRINLATQLGNGLCGTLYVLDEPSIGLHAADTDRLIRVLENLRDAGNTVVVVEHDLQVMRHADWLLEIGPGSGRYGGEVIASGNAEALMSTERSITGRYLSGQARIERTRPARPPGTRHLRITGCREHNLQDITVDFPLERLTVVTGVSGSGKSTLVHKTLFPALCRYFNQPHDPIGRFDKLYGAENLSGVVLLDQSPIGRSSRSNPATYIKAWDEVRHALANQVLSLRRGYTPQHFSFNVDGGRCPVCKGEGEVTVDMHFLAEIRLPCEECEGRRFKRDILDITYRGKNVHEILSITIDDAYDLFRDNVVLARKLGILRSVGLGYLQMGQSGTTLSGGESQRLKIAAALDQGATQIGRRLLYLFDEPTTGLHSEDIKKLMEVIHDLVDAKNTVILIEHNLDVIAQADWIVDIGPGGGKKGGMITASGSPESLIKDPQSITGKILAREAAVPSLEAE